MAESFWGERARRWSAAAALLLALGWCAWVGPARAWATLVDVGRTARGVPVTALVTAVALGLLQYVLMALRLHVLAHPPWPPVGTVRRLGFPLLLGAIAPARIGDLAKIAVVAESGGVARATGTVMVADKLADVVVGSSALLLGVTAVGASLGPGAWRAVAVLGAVAGGIVVAASVVAHRRAPAGGRVRRIMADLLTAASSPRRLGVAVALAGIGWTTEATALSVVAGSAGAPLALPGALFSLAVLNVAVFVSILPANAGTFEAALGLALVRAGVPATSALGIAVVHHLCQIGSVALVALATALLPRAGRRALSAANKEDAIRHYDRRANRYDALVSAGPLRWLRERERRAVLELADLADPAVRTIIDVGCGDGYYARAARDAGKLVHAVDAAPGMVERVRAIAHAAFVADVEHLESDVRYDLVLCCGVLDFARDPDVAFDRLCRLCAPGGRLVVLVARLGPCAAPYVLEKRLAGLRVNLFDRAALARRAARNGLVLSRALRPLPYNEALLFTPGPAA